MRARHLALGTARELQALTDRRRSRSRRRRREVPLHDGLVLSQKDPRL